MTERQLKTKCIQWLKIKSHTNPLWWYCPADRFISGIPDIIICSCGKFLWVELKKQGGKTTVIQDWMHSQIQKAHGVGRVIENFIEFKLFLERMGI